MQFEDRLKIIIIYQKYKVKRCPAKRYVNSREDKNHILKYVFLLF